MFFPSNLLNGFMIKHFSSSIMSDLIPPTPLKDTQMRIMGFLLAPQSMSLPINSFQVELISIMFNINPLENLKLYISSRPPLVVFMISVSAMAIAFLTLGYFFKIKEIKSPEMAEVQYILSSISSWLGRYGVGNIFGLFTHLYLVVTFLSQ